MSNTRYIFVTGGVMSSLGKGLASASLGALLQARRFSVCVRKLDLYLNVDPGTLSPYQHGEVFVTDDGTESDLDLGHYERYTGRDAVSGDYLTTGQVYSGILTHERRGDYLGATVQVIPHVTDAIKDFITANTDPFDFVICEIGGTVGDIEGAPFLEAIRQLRNDLGADNTMFVHLTYLPYVRTAGEQKTKPTQHSVKDLLHAGIQPDLLLCRCEIPLSGSVRKKIALFCNVQPENVIAALDVDNIYRVPLNYSAERFDERVCEHFHLNSDDAPISNEWLSNWNTLNHNLENPEKEVTVAIVGKYTELLDAYKSIKEALLHAAAANRTKIKFVWSNSEKTLDVRKDIWDADAILVPGGFGARGIDNKIEAIRYARENNIPFFGICLGMQLALIEAFRNLGGLAEAGSTEFGHVKDPIICLMSEWEKDGGKEYRSHNDDMGGTMRLGAYPCHLERNSMVHEIYDAELVYERHRHRYEFNMQNYGDKLESIGIRVAGKSPDGMLAEIIERPDHPWFVAVQFHPEFKSRPLAPHPLFVSFIEHANKHKEAQQSQTLRT